MNLSSDLISQFVKVTTNKDKKKTESVVYGTVVKYDGALYVKLDGSDLLTPMESTADVKDGERVTIMIKDHTATITGNITSPSARKDDVTDINNKVVSQGNDITLINNEITSIGNTITQQGNTIKQQGDTITSIGNTVTSQDNKISAIENTVTAQGNTITAQGDKITSIGDQVTSQSNTITALGNTIEAQDTSIKTINSNMQIYNTSFQITDGVITGIKGVDTDWITTKNLEADHAIIGTLETKYADVDFANINQAAVTKLFTESGIIKDLVVSEGHITGELVGVTIKGDVIEGSTVKADKLVVLGSDGLYYKLNTDGVSTTAEQTEYNSLNGSVITAKTITAEKVNVDDLVAFGATIGGFHITQDSIYSGVKESIANTTRGIYFNNDGEFSFGDASNFFKFYKDTNGLYKLDISASSIKFATGKTVDMVIQESVDNIQIGGKNLLRGSNITELYPDQLWENGHFKVGSGGDGVGSVVPIKDTPIPGIDNAVQILGNTTGNRDIAQTVTPMVADREYTFSVWVKGTGKLYIRVGMNLDTGWTADKTLFQEDIAYTTWTRFVKTFTTNSTIAERTMQFGIKGECTEILFVGPKLELGNKATDWTPAPEDVDTSISNVEDNFEGRLDDVNISIETAQSSIDMLSNMISNLVTDSDGSSLMTQTPDGWTFNMSSITDNLTAIKDAMSTMDEENDATKNSLDSLTELINEVANKTAYITMSTDDNGDPCIELGKTDSLFKVRITNTAIDFLEGSNKLAYANNNTFYSETTVVKNELQIGEGPGFVWGTRENGNLGLVYVS